MSDRDEFGAFLVGFIVGGLTGAVVSLLMAPQSGEETRALIKDKSIELRDKAQITAEEALAKAEAAAAEARARADEMAKQLKERGTEVVSTAKEKGQEVIATAKTKGSEAVENVKKVAKPKTKKGGTQDAAA
ncbi:MAG: hypothetical protein Kow002_03150 [Anaerolineales bacterium]